MGETTLTILALDPDFAAVWKPAGFHVHQPERPRPRVDSNIVCLSILRDQIGRRVHPVHRLDVPTAGVLLFALNPEAASLLGRSFSERCGVVKTYFAIVRGFAPDEGVIDEPLMSDSSDRMVEALTRFRTCARVQLERRFGKRDLPARFSLAQAMPETGRFHQIRRHFARLAHPLVGDSEHGDSHQNRFFREEMGVRGLMLQARRLEFPHPRSREAVSVQAPWSEAWLAAARALGWESELDGL